ncbi:hypothetical protein GGX14DRAFT_395819 [Mycena pura]|uniref:Uncharacterized protein n=1 Tax=Mycena pura TaxID=153505 RepID=A0AAD6VC33_9AGAR|nr:hypothetical protein GGX14DRAFT_395819 [Mycena pura]
MSDSSFTTLGLDYEPSQAHHEIRIMREVELTEEERQSAALDRHRKRQRKGYSPLTSPVKPESKDKQIHRATAEQARHIISDFYGPFGLLNSQIGEGTCIDRLIDGTTVPEPNTKSQEAESQAPDHSQDPESDHDSDHELEVQVSRPQNRLKIVLQEHDELQDQCDQYKQAFRQADAERTQLREQLQQWEQAATAAFELTKLLHPYSA